MSKITQRHKELKAKGHVFPASASPRAPSQPELREPRFATWQPGTQDDPRLRYWQTPRLGDIVQCRFPDFLKGEFSFRTMSKVRPCMVVGVEEFASGQVAVKVAYGSSQIEDHEGRVDGHRQVIEGIQPGEVLAHANDPKTGLTTDTKFSFRKVLELPFSTDHFAPAEGLKFGVYPKRGSFDLSKPENRRAMDSAIREAQQLGSALEDTGHGMRIKRDVRTGQHVR